MTPDSLSWGSPGWLLPLAGIVAVALVMLVRSYLRSSATPAVRLGAALLKASGLVALALCLVEPLVHGRRPRPGANLFVVLADNSESIKVRDQGEERSRGDLLREWLDANAPWSTRLGQDFDVRRYIFDSRLGGVEDFSELTLGGHGTALGASLDAITRRYGERPLAGVLVFTDGNATDLEGGKLDTSKLPPIYPVVVGGEGPVRDLAVKRLAVSQTNFESAPVTVQAEILHQGYAGDEVVAQILDDGGTKIEEVTERADDSGRLTARFELRPEGAGVHFYRVRVSARSESEDSELPEDAEGPDAPGEPRASSEATLANNSQLLVVDRSRGPYRILYVSGRPNWEFKFLRRALKDDEEIELVGLIRIAKREPKFDYRSRYGESTNPLFRGFGNETDEEAERYDEPVLLRIGTVDEEELRDGFPKAADQLFRYDAVILDDVEAEYFTQDQMILLQEFVSQRGGGFLMLGGQESFTKGKYHRTPIGELLPVYLEAAGPFSPSKEGYRFALTREGKIQPWVRLRKTEEAEHRRLEEMPAFHTLNPASGIKPGATVLARVTDDDGKALPALVTQRFGRGRSAALLLGDFWRWALRRKSAGQNDQAKAWRQTVRWLVADVPRRIETGVHLEPGGSGSSVRLAVRVRDEKYDPLDNASVVIEISGPEGKPLELTAEASAKEPGLYEVDYTPRQAGAFRARVKARGPDGDELPERQLGWTAEPAAREYGKLKPNRALLERLALDSGGEVVNAGDLEDFVATLPNRRIPITEPWVYPLWHQWSVFLLAVFCLTGEWALRRWKGLP